MAPSPKPGDKNVRKDSSSTVEKPSLLPGKPIPFSGPSVKVLVGSDEVVFNIHRDLLVRSTWFKAALDGSFLEAETGVIRLPEDDPAVFTLYAHWLYTSSILTPPNAKDEGRRQRRKALFSAYVWGDKIRHVDFMNAVMDNLISLTGPPPEHHAFPSVNDTIFVYDNIVDEKSPMKQLLIDQGVYHGKSDWYRGRHLGRLPTEFVQALLDALLSTRNRPAHSRCTVHDAARYYVKQTTVDTGKTGRTDDDVAMKGS